MKKVLLASTAVAAFVAFSGTARAQDPGMADFGATEGGGGAGSAFTVKTNGAVKFYLKYASGDESLNDGKGSNSGLFTLVSSELEINSAATTDNGTDISTHIDFDFSGVPTDSAETVRIGGGEDTISIGDIVRVDELSMKIGGGWGSVELGANDGAEDIFKLYGGTIAAGTGGVDGDQHTVKGGVNYAGTGGNAGSGDSGDALKATYLSPKVSGFQAGVSVVYATDGPNDINGGTMGVGVGAKYAGSAGGFDYAVSVVWGDTAIVGDTSGAGIVTQALVDRAAATGADVSELTRIGYYETEHDRVYGLAATVTAGTTAGTAARAAFITALNLGTTAPSDDQNTAANAAGLAANLGARAALAGVAGSLELAKDEVKAAIAAAGAAAVAAVRLGGPNADEIAASTGGFDAHYGGLGIGVKLGGAGVSGVVGVTLDELGRHKDYYGDDLSKGFNVNLNTGVAYAIPGGKSNVSVTAALQLPHGVASGETEASNYLGSYLVMASADYAVLPGVTIATDLGYGDSDVDDEDTKSGGFTGLVRVKAAF